MVIILIDILFVMAFFTCGPSAHLAITAFLGTRAYAAGKE